MKTLNLGTFRVGETEIKEADLVGQSIKTPPKDGFNDVADYRMRLKILDKLDAAVGGVLELEDAEAEKVKAYFKFMPWVILDKGLLALIDKVEAL